METRPMGAEWVQYHIFIPGVRTSLAVFFGGHAEMWSHDVFGVLTEDEGRHYGWKQVYP
jgi:hypothetical protein